MDDLSWTLASLVIMYYYKNLKGELSHTRSRLRLRDVWKWSTTRNPFTNS